VGHEVILILSGFTWGMGMYCCSQSNVAYFKPIHQVLVLESLLLAFLLARLSSSSETLFWNSRNYRTDDGRSVFKYFFRARSERMEAESMSYAVLARVLRDGGLRVAIVARWSAIPPHCKFWIQEVGW
jgi:hypothetical protein